MKPLIHYIKRNWKGIVVSILLGLCIALWAIPSVLSLSLVKNFLALDSSPTFVLLAVISYTVLILLYDPALSFWIRYKNNFKLREIPFTYMDSLLICLASVTISASIFHINILNHIWVSGLIKVWIFTFIAMFTFILGLIVYKGTNTRLFSSPVSKKQSAEDVFPDEPISDETEDLLGRKDFVESFYKQIVEYPSSDSFTFGLYGGWGEGKTSVINLLKNKLKKDDNIIIYEFDPWYYSSSEALAKHFYDGLYSCLNKSYFLPNIKGLFIKYQKLLSSAVGLSGFNIDIRLSESIDEVKGKIEQWISGTGKIIIIIMDDIDRLQIKEEILEIFKIIRLSARFNNTIFIVSLDPIKISSFLKDVAAVDPTFLEKIIQSAMYLPAIDHSMIDRFLFYSFPNDGHYSAIDRLFQKLEIDSERVKALDAQDFIFLYETQIKRLFPTLRQAKRYLNGLYATLPAVKNEVNIEDFLILEVLRSFYPEIYRDIWEHPWFYLPSSWSEKTYLFSPLNWATDKKEKAKKTKEYITQIVSGQNEAVLELLKTIFPVEIKKAFETHIFGHSAEPNEARAEKRITHPEVFPKYFMLKVPSSDLSDEMIEGMISEWERTDSSHLDEKILSDFQKYQKNAKLQEIFIKLNVFLSKLEPDVVNAIIRSIYKNINTFSKKGRENLWRSEFDWAESLLLQLLETKSRNEEIESLMLQVIGKTPSLFLAVSLVLVRREKRGNFSNIWQNVNLESLQQSLSDRLTQYFIEGKKDIIKEESEDYGFILYQWGKNNEQDRKKVNDYLYNLVDQNPTYLGKLLSRYVIKWASPLEVQFNYDDLIKVYYEEELHKRVKSRYLEAYSTADEKAALDLFLKIYDEKHKGSL